MRGIKEIIHAIVLSSSQNAGPCRAVTMATVRLLSIRGRVTHVVNSVDVSGHIVLHKELWQIYLSDLGIDCH